MSVSPEFKLFIQDQLAEFGAVKIRSMFGGGGIFYQDVMFAIIANDRLYFKADDGNRADFEDAGMMPFTYEARGKTATMSYWELPDRLYDDAEELTVWAQRAFAAAKRSKSA